MVLWLLFALLPDVYFWKRVTGENRRSKLVLLGVTIIAVLLCFAFFEWDIISFLTE